MSVTVLVLSVDEDEHLRACLPAIVGQDGADVVVVDNACTDSTPEVAEELGARVLRLAHRLSYAAALNVAIGATGGDLVLLLNADCVADPGFLEPLREALEADPGLGSAAPKLLRADGLAIDAAGVTVDRRRKNTLVGHGAAAGGYALAGPAFGGDGAAVLWRRRALEDCAVGNEILDEDMALWATESDLAWRAQLRGWRCAYEPRAVARHLRTYSPSTPRAELAPEHRRLQFRNRLLMAYKNETAWGLLRDWPWLLAYELAAFGFALLRDRALLRGYADVRAALPAARRRRDVVQSRRTVRRPPFGLTPRR
ncbi:MAG: glycosyl transferase [Solirubrobacterales bacterium]|nr:glycosyl transferase [Solirubrobacterales bacterium]